MTPRVLVVDDDAGVRYTLASLLSDAGLEVEQAEDGERALACLDAGTFHLVVSDLRMPRLDGLSLLRRLKARADAPKLILITAHGSERAAVEAMKLGAYDYFRKPFDIDELVGAVERAVESVRLRDDNERLAAELALSRSMVFASPQMSALAVLVRRVSRRDVTVLITGQSGTGKERLAEAIVAQSPRKGGPFVRFNCAALSPELAEAELFGHARGAFTGAVGARPGLFRRADGGTLFLDEVAELSLRTQAALLRVLQEGEVRPVGSEDPISVDVRMLAATHQDLERAVKEGRFREDLYYRLRVVELTLPPLRERPGDIVALATHFLHQACDRFGSERATLDDTMRSTLLARAWPGNVRELRNAIESLVALSPAGALDPSVLDRPGPTPTPLLDAPGSTLAARMAAFERSVLVDALARAGGNRTAAAKHLGIGRATLYEKLDKHGLGSPRG